MIKKLIITSALTLSAAGLSIPAASASVRPITSYQPVTVQRLTASTRITECGTVYGSRDPGPGPCGTVINANDAIRITIEVTGPRLPHGYNIEMVANNRVITHGYIQAYQFITVNVPRGTRSLEVISNRAAVSYDVVTRTIYETITRLVTPRGPSHIV